MPYKDLEKRRENSRNYYSKNKERISSRTKKYLKTPNGIESRRKALKKYNKSEKRKEANKRFHNSPTHKLWVRTCQRNYQRERSKLPEVKKYLLDYNKKYSKLPEVKEARYLQYLDRMYNMRLEDYNKILKTQNGLCAICLNHAKTNRLCVDHSHFCCPENKSCGKCTRGLLCYKCNSLLGDCNDSTVILKMAIQYLHKYRKVAVGIQYKKNLRWRGLGKEDFSRLFYLQKGCCAICLKPQKHKRLAIDHDHSKGIIRSLLCEKCNFLLGHGGESEVILKSAITYLERYKK